MDKLSRAELIRAIHRAKVGGMAYKSSGKPLRPNTDPIESRGWGVWGKRGIKRSFYAPKADSLIFERLPEKETGPRIKRSQGDSPLTAISVKAVHKKLVRSFPTAEALLAERTQRLRP